MHSGRRSHDTVDSVCDSGVEVSDVTGDVSVSLGLHLPSPHTCEPADDDQTPVVTQAAPPRPPHDPLQLFETDDDGDTKLHLAIVNGDIMAVQYLVSAAYSHGSSHLLDIQNTQYGHTVLHLAVCVNRPSFVRLLIVAGALPNMRSRLGQTPLLMACARRQPGCISSMMRSVDDSERQQLTNYCLDVGLPLGQLLSPHAYSAPDTNLLDFRGRSCLHCIQSWKSDAALATERLNVIDFLVHACGADVNIQEGSGGLTLLHLAVKQRDDELFTYLLEQCSVDVNKLTYGRRTALDLACSQSAEGQTTTMIQSLRAAAGKHSPHFSDECASSSSSDDSSL